MTAFWRYWLLQIPGWGVLIVALAAAHRYVGLPVLWAIVFFGIWLLKDWALYPILKTHYRFRVEHPQEDLVGKRAKAREALRPRGYVQIRGELWLAELAKGADPAEPGDEVEIVEVEGLTLRVRPVPPAR